MNGVLTGPFQSEGLFTAEDLFTSAEFAFEGAAYQQPGFHSGTSPVALVTYDVAFQQSAFGPPLETAHGGGAAPGESVQPPITVTRRESARPQAPVAPGRQVTVTLVAGAHREVMFDKRV